MTAPLYSTNTYPVQTLLTWIESKEVAIPEIQRPFVWKGTQVRDFIDSLYRGYPVGYLVAWRNPNVRLKDGKPSHGKRVLIDGQQRVTALLAALLGQQVVNNRYKRERITIAFHPREEKFEVGNSAIIRGDHSWIPDIAEMFRRRVRLLQLVDRYCSANAGANRDAVYDCMERLTGVKNNMIGLIELNADVDVETVTEIFVRINSKGVQLSSADFAMSKMAAGEKYDGHRLRKCVDYFCHLATSPEAYADLAEDEEFVNTEYFGKMKWLRKENDDLYEPNYTDMLRVSFTSEFKRGRLNDLVALLSGRNFKRQTYEESIAEDSFNRLGVAVNRFVNEHNFKNFVMILRSAGFVDSKMARPKNNVNFAYVLYLALRASGARHVEIETIVRRWFVMSILTARYSGAVDTAFERDIRGVDEIGARLWLEEIERTEMSVAFWDEGLPQHLSISTKSSPYFVVFLASQVMANDKGFLSKDHTVHNLLEGSHDVHHIFPRMYLKKHGFSPSRYNQIANLVAMQKETNIALRDTPPEQYFAELNRQCNGENVRYGAITDSAMLAKNRVDHCIPDGIENMGIDRYDSFLKKRRQLMSAKIKLYYRSL